MEVVFQLIFVAVSFLFFGTLRQIMTRYLFFLPQGYTPLHIAMQFGHEDIHNLLVQVYSEYLFN